jgi:hypothetical protein
MNTQTRHIVWLGLLSALLLALLVLAAWAPGGPLAVGAASAASNSPTALTPGQNAAIQGAEQLLLLSSSGNQIYLPLIRR